MKKRTLCKFLILGLLFLISCQKDEVVDNKSLKVDRSEIRAQIALHSKGLDYFFNKKINVAKSSLNRGVYTVGNRCR